MPPREPHTDDSSESSAPDPDPTPTNTDAAASRPGKDQVSTHTRPKKEQVSSHATPNSAAPATSTPSDEPISSRLRSRTQTRPPSPRSSPPAPPNSDHTPRKTRSKKRPTSRTTTRGRGPGSGRGRGLGGRGGGRGSSRPTSRGRGRGKKLHLSDNMRSILFNPHLHRSTSSRPRNKSRHDTLRRVSPKPATTSTHVSTPTTHMDRPADSYGEPSPPSKLNIHANHHVSDAVFIPLPASVANVRAYSSLAFAVVWYAGGGVYITRAQADSAVSWARAHQLSPSNPIIFNATQDLYINLTAAEAYIRRAVNPSQPTPISRQPTHTPPPPPPANNVPVDNPHPTQPTASTRPVSPEFQRALTYLAKHVPGLSYHTDPTQTTSNTGTPSTDTTSASPTPTPQAPPQPKHTSPLPTRAPSNTPHSNTPQSADPSSSAVSTTTATPAPTPQSAASPAPTTSSDGPVPSTPRPVPATPGPSPATATPTATAPVRSSGTLVGEHNWAFSRTDTLIHKQLLKYGGGPVVVLANEFPEPYCLSYMASPGTSGGIVVCSSDTQRVELRDGGLVLRPQRLPTLSLHNFPSAMDLCFRAVRAASISTNEFASSVATAIPVLQQECTRQYQELCVRLSFRAASELWQFLFYARWTYMVLKRAVPTGYNADAAFLNSAKIIQARGDATPAALAGRPAATTPSASSSSTAWSICYKCGEVNTHKSPACTVVGSVVSKAVRAKVTAAIDTAPVTASQRQELLKIARAYYAKLDRQQ